MSSAFSFTVISNNGKPSYWPGGAVTYRLHNNVPAGALSPLRSSFQSWEDVSGLALSISELSRPSGSSDSEDGENFINWVTSGWRNLSFYPPRNALAVTLLSFDSGSGVITDADIYFNAEFFSWGVVGGAGTGSLIDIQNIGTHEVGHLLGLDHSSEEYVEPITELSEATMYWASEAGEISRRDLNNSDMTGIRALYGTDGAQAPTIASFEQTGIDEDGLVIFRVNGSGFTEYTSFVLAKGGSTADRVARYRTIESDSQASISLDLSGFPNGGASLIAFNHPGNLNSISVTVDSSSFSATSGGGGGCAVRSGTDDFSWTTFYFSFFSFISLLLARRRLRQMQFDQRNPLKNSKHNF